MDIFYDRVDEGCVRFQQVSGRRRPRDTTEQLRTLFAEFISQLLDLFLHRV